MEIEVCPSSLGHDKLRPLHQRLCELFHIASRQGRRALSFDGDRLDALSVPKRPPMAQRMNHAHEHFLKGQSHERLGKALMLIICHGDA